MRQHPFPARHRLHIGGNCVPFGTRTASGPSRWWVDASREIMRQRNPAGNFWPTRMQETMLTAALGGPQEAASAWRAVQHTFSLDEMEPGTFALLPLVYRNLSLAGVDDHRMPRLKGIYRRSFVLGSMLLDRIQETQRVLADAGVDALFVDGAVLGLRFYDDVGLRPTSMIDALVRPQSLPTVSAVMRQARWFRRPDLTTRLHGPRYFSDKDANLCVVRTVLAPDFSVRGDPGAAHEPMWAAAEALTIGDTHVRVPSPTDTALAICVSHGRAWQAANVQWLIDLATLLAIGGIDWTRLADLSVAGGQARRLRDALGYLSRLPGGTRIPEDIRMRLAGVRATPRERLAYACAAGAVGGRGLPLVLAEHLAETADQSPARVAATFPRRLAEAWGVEPAHLPRAAAARAVRLVRGRFRGKVE